MTTYNLPRYFTTLTAGNTYNQVASDVISGHTDENGNFVASGDVSITAKDINIEAGYDTYSGDSTTKSKQSGLTIAFTGGVVAAIESAASSISDVGESKNSRVNAMATANAAYNDAKEIQKIKDSITPEEKQVIIHLKEMTPEQKAKFDAWYKATLENQALGTYDELEMVLGIKFAKPLGALIGSAATKLGTSTTVLLERLGVVSPKWVESSSFLRNITLKKGNFGIGSSTAEKSNELGKAWVGDGYRVASDGKTLVSSDGLRVYRLPTNKPNSPYATTGTQSNFEEFIINAQGKKIQIRNGHMDIVP